MVKELPKWLRPYLAAGDIASIQEAVTKAEMSTIGEVVPMIVRRSSTIGHVYPLLAFSIFSLLLMLTHEPAWFEWVGRHGPLVIGSAFAISFLIAWPLARLPVLQRLLTTAKDRWYQACQRAELEFFLACLNQTKGNTGILIFISLLEHQVYVLADKGISEKLPPHTWEEISLQLVEAIRNKSFAKGLKEAVERCGVILAEHYPAGLKNLNELHDELIIKE